MENLETSAKTVEEAVELALEKLGASREEVEVVVLKEGKPGIFGFGGEDATVRVLRRRSDEVKREAAALATQMLEKLLSLMRVSASIEIIDEKETSQEERAAISLEINGDDLGILIGRRGQTLASLQYLVYLMVSHQLKARVNITIDVAGYRERRKEALRNLAWRMAERVMATGQTVPLEPMSASERRIIHLSLRDYHGVITQSVGEGDYRKVTILKAE
jgi:spoIIIJ-associated protein